MGALGAPHRRVSPSRTRTPAPPVEDLTNTVYGVDVTYGIDSEDGLSGWTFGAEALANTGDLGAEDDGGGGLDVYNGESFGYYLWAEHRLDVQDTIGVLYSSFEHGEEESPIDQEITAYWSHYFSEFSRLRIGASHLDSEEGADSTRLLVQLTAFFGPHAHWSELVEVDPPRAAARRPRCDDLRPPFAEGAGRRHHSRPRRPRRRGRGRVRGGDDPRPPGAEHARGPREAVPPRGGLARGPLRPGRALPRARLGPRAPAHGAQSRRAAWAERLRERGRRLRERSRCPCARIARSPRTSIPRGTRT